VKAHHRDVYVPAVALPITSLQLSALDADKLLRAVENAPADGFCEGNPLTESFFKTALVFLWGIAVS
jgi:hypothetical protein